MQQGWREGHRNDGVSGRQVSAPQLKSGHAHVATPHSSSTSAQSVPSPQSSSASQYSSQRPQRHRAGASHASSPAHPSAQVPYPSPVLTQTLPPSHSPESLQPDRQPSWQTWPTGHSASSRHPTSHRESELHDSFGKQSSCARQPSRQRISQISPAAQSESTRQTAVHRSSSDVTSGGTPQISPSSHSESHVHGFAQTVPRGFSKHRSPLSQSSSLSQRSPNSHEDVDPKQEVHAPTKENATSRLHVFHC
jgi:hypothetical protein